MVMFTLCSYLMKLFLTHNKNGQLLLNPLYTASGCLPYKGFYNSYSSRLLRCFLFVLKNAFFRFCIYVLYYILYRITSLFVFSIFAFLSLVKRRTKVSFASTLVIVAFVSVSWENLAFLFRYFL